MEKVNTAIILDTRSINKDQTHAVRLRITNKGKRKTYLTGIKLTKEEWANVQGDYPRKQYKEYKTILSTIENRAIEVIRSMTTFSFEKFENQFNHGKNTSNDLFTLFENYIQLLKTEQRISTANSYTDALSSFKKFASYLKRKKIYPEQINPIWLKKFEDWKVNDGASPSTAGIYLRYLRNIINIEIDKGNFSKDDYPFGKRKYQIPASRNIKKALSIKEIEKLNRYEPVSIPEGKAKALWFFSYLANGMNMKDIANLRFKQISEKSIIFYRSKTKLSTKMDNKPILVPLLPQIKTIIDKWGQKEKNGNNFIFDILSAEDDLETQNKKIKQATKNTNKYLKRIAQRIGINSNLTTYVARHSYATVLKRSGAPIEFISESLGHKDLKTTENYLDSFEDETREKYQRKLLDFS